MERYKYRMDKIVKIALVTIIVILLCVDYILGLLSKTRVLRKHSANPVFPPLKVLPSFA